MTNDIGTVEPTEESQFALLVALMRRLVLAGRSSFGHGERAKDHNRADCDSCRAVVQAHIFLRSADEYQAIVEAAERQPEA